MFLSCIFTNLTTFQTNQQRKTSLRTFQKIVGKKKTSKEEKQEQGGDTRPQSYSASHNDASYNLSHNVGETRSSNVLQRQKRSRSTDPVRARFSRPKWEESYYKGIELEWTWMICDCELCEENEEKRRKDWARKEDECEKFVVREGRGS